MDVNSKRQSETQLESVRYDRPDWTVRLATPRDLEELKPVCSAGRNYNKFDSMD